MAASTPSSLPSLAHGIALLQPPPWTPQSVPPAGGHVATPTVVLCSPGSHLSSRTGKALRERSGLSLQHSTLDFILPSGTSPPSPPKQPCSFQDLLPAK